MWKNGKFLTFAKSENLSPIIYKGDTVIPRSKINVGANFVHIAYFSYL